MRHPRGFTRRGLLAGASALPLSFALRPARAQIVPAAAPVAAAPAAPPAPPAVNVHAEFTRQDPRRVAEVVGVSHRDLDKVRALVEETPALANATWDWGFGDWETALGAASHTGRREIAEYLIAKGARPTLHSAAMLGQLEVVKAMVRADPASARIAGPHGIPLLEHARAGGERAREVLEYLETIGAPVAAAAVPPLDKQQRERHFGRYRFGPGDDDVLEVLEQAETLAIRRGEGARQRLIPVGGEQFHPPGVPSVSIRFEVEGDLVKAIAIEDGALVIRGVRVAG